jgi:transposase-like protein
MTASRVCQELRDRYRAFCARSLSGVELLAVFLDAIYLPTRPSGAKEGVLVAWGYDLNGKRELLAVSLGHPPEADWRTGLSWAGILCGEAFRHPGLR